jgi:serine/threonine protein phosphatase PrpC
MGAKVSTAGNGSPTDEGSATSAKQSAMYDEVVEIRREGDATEELSVHFGYQCQSTTHGTQRSTDTISELSSSLDDAVSVTLPSNPLTRRNSSFSSLSGAALGANATLANSCLFNGRDEMLPTLDSPKTFRKLDPIYRTSSLNSSLSSLTQSLSIASQSVPGDLASYANSFLHAPDVQMAGGAAGEDRVQAVCSEDNGWLFCGIFDGFNGRDAADFLAGTLYENIALKLEYKSQKRQSLLDAESDSSDMDYSDTESSDLPHHGVLEGLQQALVQTESDFLAKVEQEMEERPDLVMVGSCVLVVLMHGRNLYTLNLGDSRAVLATTKPQPKTHGSKKRKSSGLYAVELTERHVVEDARERERIISEHPEDPRAISNGRLKGKLRVTRAFGAGYLKKASSAILNSVCS